MQKPPLSVIRAWPTPNYVDPLTRGNENVVINIILYIFLLGFISLRVFTRTYLGRNFGSDDAFILIALIPTTAFFIISILAHTKFLWIRHVYDIPMSNATTGLKMVLAAEIMFAAACTFTKLSILMLVRRMLASASLFWRRITLLAIIVVSIQGGVFFVTIMFQCRPPQDYWKLTDDSQQNCVNQSSSLLAAGILSTLTDFAVVLLPIRAVWSLQLPRRQTIIIIVLFGLGFVSTGAGIARIYYMYKVTKTWDQTWASYPVWMTSAIELYIGVICASIPATKLFFSTFLPQIFGSPSTTNSNYSSQGQSQQQGHVIFIGTGSGGEEELLEFEKGGLGIGKGFSTSTVATKPGSQGTSDDDLDYIRITQQTVVHVSVSEKYT